MPIKSVDSAHRGDEDMLAIECRACGRTLGRESVAAGVLSVVCSRCKTHNRLQFDRPALLPRYFDWGRVCELYGRPGLATY